MILPEILQELYGLMEALVQKGKNTNVLQETLDTKPTVLYLWSSLSGIIQISAQKKKQITKQTGMTMEEYRSFAFRTLYESLVQKKASGE